MCGINGILALAKPQAADLASMVSDMNQSIAYRGPDNEGLWSSTDGRMTLGHRRLSILDLSANANQPMLAGDQVISYNGEIYNFRDLREQYLKGVELRTDGDTEVLLQLMRKFGTEAFSLLNGMFAFAFWDGDNGKLLLARDRIGIKPLYYYLDDKYFVFSSEIRAFLVLRCLGIEIDEEGLSSYIASNRVPGNRTVFAGIRKLMPGHVMTVGFGGIESDVKYWSAKIPEQRVTSLESTSRKLLDCLTSAVGRRMVSDVPIGAFLSGGVDSSAVVGLMRRQSDRKIHTYSVGFEGAPNLDESKYAREIARKFDTQHHEITLREQDVIACIDEMVEIFDDPLADPTSIPIFLMSRKAREDGVKVILTGDGADELFFGYESWMRHRRYYPIHRLLRRLPFLIAAARSVARVLGVDTQLLSEMLTRAENDTELFQPSAGGLHQELREKILSSSIGKAGNTQLEAVRRLYAEYEHASSSSREVVDWMCYSGICEVQPNYFLYRADKLGMANSIEIRVPYLDHELVEFGLSISPALKGRGNVQKFVLKRALEPILPRNTIYRKKAGFCVPLATWLTGWLVEEIESKRSHFCREFGIFDAHQLARWLSVVKPGSDSDALDLWNVLYIMSWVKHWGGGRSLMSKATAAGAPAANSSGA